MTATTDPRPAMTRLAGQSVTAACELACLVRDEGRDGIARFLATLDLQQLWGMAVALAAMVPIDRTPADLLAWIDWDDQTVFPGATQPIVGTPVRERYATTRRTSGPVQPCGTYAAYNRHKARNEPIDQACQEAARAYWADRAQQRRNTARTAPARPALSIVREGDTHAA